MALNTQLPTISYNTKPLQHRLPINIMFQPATFKIQQHITISKFWKDSIRCFSASEFNPHTNFSQHPTRFHNTKLSQHWMPINIKLEKTWTRLLNIWIIPLKFQDSSSKCLGGDVLTRSWPKNLGHVRLKKAEHAVGCLLVDNYM